MKVHRHSKTTHIFPVDDGWVIRSPKIRRSPLVYATQKEAVDAARETLLHAPAGQIVVHSRNGLMRSRYAHGMSVIQKSPVKSKLGAKAIERAISAVIRKRLEQV